MILPLGLVAGGSYIPHLVWQDLELDGSSNPSAETVSSVRGLPDGLILSSGALELPSWADRQGILLGSAGSHQYFRNSRILL